jgi:hypothetical protein
LILQIIQKFKDLKIKEKEKEEKALVNGVRQYDKVKRLKFL